MVRDATLDGVVVAADEEAVVARARYLQPAEMPEEAVELKAAIARRERLRREVQDRSLAAKSEEVLLLAGGPVVAAGDGDGGRDVICPAAHLDCLPRLYASDGRGQRGRQGHRAGIRVGPVRGDKNIPGRRRLWRRAGLVRIAALARGVHRRYHEEIRRPVAQDGAV